MAPAVDHNDLVLLLLGTPAADGSAGRVEGITRLEKLAFLLERETDFHKLAKTSTERLTFEPYHYGPYTRELYDAVDLLVNIGLVSDSRRWDSSSLDVAEELEALDPGETGRALVQEGRYSERVLELTEKGRYVSEVLAEQVGDEAVAALSSLKTRFGVMPLRQLLRYVYRRHPDMTGQSRIKDKL